MSRLSPFDGAWDKGRTSVRQRVTRLRSKAWHVGQCSIAAAVAWLVATEVFGHTTPFFAPIAAVLCLGTSYGQRLRRVAEVTVGVAVGVFIADLLVVLLGSGWWQLGLIVALAMSAAFLLDAGALFVTQAAVQSIVVTTLIPDPDEALVRWTDALIGGGVAILAAAIVPRAPLRRPREQAAVVIRTIAALLRATAESALDGDMERALDVLASARSTDGLIRELQAAADEGLSVVASSPFRRRHKGHVRRMAELVEPMDRAMRNTRVLVRRVAAANYHGEQLPRSYLMLCADLADAADEMAAALDRDEMPAGIRAALLRIGEGTAQLERTPDLSAEVVLAQIRSIVIDLLQITGLDVLAATDAIPIPSRLVPRSARPPSLEAMSETPRHRRPSMPGAAHFETLPGSDDPTVRSDAADHCATLLVRGARDLEDEAVVARVVSLADSEGLEMLADLWASAPGDSLAGCLWRLYLLRSWVYADPAAAAREFDEGRRHSPVHEAVAGVVEPPGPDEVRQLVDLVLRGVVRGDFAVTLYRAAAFARVAASGRAHIGASNAPTPYHSDLSAAKLVTMAEQLENAAKLEIDGRLA